LLVRPQEQRKIPFKKKKKVLDWFRFLFFKCNTYIPKTYLNLYYVALTRKDAM